MKRDIERQIDTIDTVLTTPALIGSMFLLASYASHSLVLAVAVGCVTWAAAWYFWRRGSSGERRTGEDRVEIVVAQPPTPADDEAQSPPEAPEEPTSRKSVPSGIRFAQAGISALHDGEDRLEGTERARLCSL
jgi:hypothetical protein